MRWGVLGLFICFMLGEVCEMTQAASVTYDMNEGSSSSHKPHKKKKYHKKKYKSTKHKPKKHKKKEKVYSAQKIEQLLKNDTKDGVCNRLNCASKLEIAKSCLKTKSDHQKHKDCFHAFCAYGCNEEDYTTKLEVFDFCNATCSSKKYLWNIG